MWLIVAARDGGSRNREDKSKQNKHFPILLAQSLPAFPSVPQRKALRLVVTAPTSYRSAHAGVNYSVALESSRPGTLQPKASLFSPRPAITTTQGFGDFDNREMRTGGPLIALAMEKTVKQLWWDRMLRNGIPGRYVTKNVKYI